MLLARNLKYISKSVAQNFVDIFLTKIFAVVLSVASRHYQLRQYISRCNPKPDSSSESPSAQHLLLLRLNKLNNQSLGVAFLASFCLVAVGNFRTAEQHRIHGFAAILMITLDLLYFIYMAYISNLLYEHFGIESRPVTLGLFIIYGLISFMICFTTNVFSILAMGEDKFLDDTEARLKWKPEDPGYVWHVIGTVAEWAVLNSFPLMFCCLARRMKRFSMNADDVNGGI